MNRSFEKSSIDKREKGISSKEINCYQQEDHIQLTFKSNMTISFKCLKSVNNWRELNLAMLIDVISFERNNQWESVEEKTVHDVLMLSAITSSECSIGKSTFESCSLLSLVRFACVGGLFGECVFIRWWSMEIISGDKKEIIRINSER